MYKKRLFYGLLIIVFLVGGLIQTIGLVSNTICTLGLAIILLLVNLISKRTTKVIKYPFILLSIVIIVSGLTNSCAPLLIALYIFAFAVVPYTIYYFIRNNLFRFDFTKLLKFFLFVGIIQLPILIAQQKLGPLIVAMSARGINLEDVGYGTFFFANDHGLCFFLLSLIIYLLFQKTHLKQSSTIFYIIWFSLTVFLAGSHISSLLWLLTMAFYLLIRLNIKTFFLLVSSAALLIVTIYVTPLNDFIAEKYEFFHHKIFDKQLSFFDAEGAVEQGVPERADIVVYLSHEDLKVIGDGPYKYFDPIKKVFPKFKNYSQYLWFYNDLGVIGVLCIVIIFGALYLNNSKFFSFKLIYVILILVYSFFSNTLSDLSFMIVFSIFITKGSIPILKTKKFKQYEHTMYSIPRLAEN